MIFVADGKDLRMVGQSLILCVEMGSIKLIILAVIAGILEFLVAGMLFLMAGFAFTGFAVFSRLAVTGYAKDPLSHAQVYLGIGALIGFFVGLVGSVSAMERRRWFLSITASLTTGFWGVLMCFYTLIALIALPSIDPSLAVDSTSVNASLDIGLFAITLSAISCFLVIVARHEFRPSFLEPTE